MFYYIAYSIFIFQTAQSNGKYYELPMQNSCFVPVSLPHFTFLNTCFCIPVRQPCLFYKRFHIAQPKTIPCQTHGGALPCAEPDRCKPERTEAPLSWHSLGSGPPPAHTQPLRRLLAKGGRLLSESPQASLLFPVLENHKFIYLQYVSKIKWPQEMR